jgi:hypothetical protein
MKILGYKADACRVFVCMENGIMELLRSSESLAPSYPLIYRDGRVYENIGLVGNARLLLFVFARRQLQVVDLCLLCQLSDCAS